MVSLHLSGRYDTVRVVRNINESQCGVYVVKKRGHSEPFIKKSASGRSQVERICQEYRALKVLNHTHIAKMIECFVNLQTIKAGIIIEYYKKGDLLSLVEDHIKSQTFVPLATAKHILKGLASALAYCHFGIRTAAATPPAWDPIIHKDIKLENIFLRADRTTPGGFVPILGDFDWATNERAERLQRHRPRGAARSPGDPHWLAPEAPRITEKSDVWGLAAAVACVCQRVTVPALLRRRWSTSRGGGGGGGAEIVFVVDEARYGRRIGAVLEGMGRRDVETRWDSWRVLGEVEGL